jgi:hypothetical protein
MPLRWLNNYEWCAYLSPALGEGNFGAFLQNNGGGKREASAIGNNGFSDRFLGVFLSLGFLLQLAA